MNELMEGFGGFEHNRQTLRILEVLEVRYPSFPGLNLTWEVREGIIKHQPESDGSAPEEYAPGEAPTLEAQLVDLVDEIAYNNHDIDDGLRSKLITMEQLREVRLFREAHDRTLQDGLNDGRIIRHAIVRHIIDRCSRDLIATTTQRLQDERVETAADVRAVAGRLVCYSEEMSSSVVELKGFLFDNMYRHYRVVRMGSKARRIISDLFNAFASEPLQLPPRAQKRVAEEGVHRVTCDYIAGMTDRFALEEHSRLFDPLKRV
jgi:dGTPase